jgi:ribosomal protection tetracycline resistance protein
VDAGKTTVTEQFLFAAGAIRTAGSVDKGTAQTDSLAVERERGISVRAAITSFYWRDHKINLIDTPGHVDFSAEIERSLRALDGAVLIVSAVEGVQAHTETLWRALEELRLPTLILINKLDRMGADHQAVLAEIKRELTPHCLPLQQVRDEETSGAGLSCTWSADLYARDPSDPCNPFIQSLVESIIEVSASSTTAVSDDELLEKYLGGESLSFDTLQNVISNQTAAANCYPVFYGVSKNGIGIESLLNGVVDYLPPPSGSDEAPLSGIVFKIEHDDKLGKIAAVRLFDGKISIRDSVLNASKGLAEKVNQIKQITPQKYEDMSHLSAGDIAAICGFSNAQVGDLIGTAENIPAELKLGEPLLTVKVSPLAEVDYSALAAALLELSAEDPQLDFQWLRDEREMHININGWIQVEVLEAILKDRFNLEAKFASPTIIYKETPSTEGIGSERYTMPKPCWAVVDFLLQPGPRGSGVTYQSKVSVDKIAAKYLNEIERTITAALNQGPKGWEVTDLQITLVDGTDHVLHSRSGDFVVATPLAIMNGLVETGTTLLEPILSFRIIAPEDLFGTIASDLTRMRAVFDTPVFENGKFRLLGKIPAATSLDYPIKLSSRTGGKGKITTRLDGYEPCTAEQGVSRPFRGISPLDRAKYILQARKAL